MVGMQLRRLTRRLVTLAAPILVAAGVAATPASAALAMSGVVDLPAGSNPGRVAVDPSTGNVFVADGGNRVLVYSGDLSTRLPDVATGAGAWGVAIDPRPGSERLLVARYPGTVEVHALPGGALLCAFGATGAGLNAIAFNPDNGKAYVAVEAPARITVAGGPGNCAVTATVPTRDKPLDVAIDRTANRVYGAIHHANELAVVDGATDTFVTQVPVLAGNPFGVAVDAVHRRVYVAQNLGNQITAVGTGPTGTGPFSTADVVVGDAPASVEVDAARDTAYVGIRNLLQLGVVTGGVAQSPIALGFVPGKPAVNAATHCVYVAGTLAGAGKLARLCDAPPPPPPPPPPFVDVVAADAPGWWYRLGEASGQTMTAAAGAIAGTYYNGVALGQPDALSGDPNAAAGFNGAAAYGAVNGIAAPRQAYTLEIWMNADAPVRDGTLIDHGGAGALYVAGGRFCLRQTHTQICAPSGPLAGTWHHVAGTWDAISGVGRLYVDGVQLASATATSAPSGSGTLYVGYGQSAPWFKGRLDEAIYYPTALSAERIAAHHGAGIAMPPPPPAPQCSDGIDNDHDGQIDDPADSGCSSLTDNDERGQCQDGIDNADPEDTLIDMADPGCQSPTDNFERDPQCLNGIDDDGDLKIDHPDDPGCTSRHDDSESTR